MSVKKPLKARRVRVQTIAGRRPDRKKLRRLLAEGYRRRAQRDLQIADEWSALDDDLPDGR